MKVKMISIEKLIDILVQYKLYRYQESNSKTNHHSLQLPHDCQLLTG